MKIRLQGKMKKGMAFLLSVALLLGFLSLHLPIAALAASDDTWIVYWYLCGSDLETDDGSATDDLIEMLEVDLPENVTVVILAGGANEWQNDVCDSDYLTLLEYCSDGLYVLDAWENASMGDASTLSKFIQYGEQNYTADKKMLIFWNHGAGSAGGVCYDEQFDDDYLSLTELQEAFSDSEADFEVIGFDACLMASVDTAEACADYARYMVASEEYEPGWGWDYDGLLESLANNPGMDGAELGKAICDTYYFALMEEGVHEQATLSVVSLEHLSPVLYVLDSLSNEGVAYAGLNGSSQFFAQLGRGARNAEFYGDAEVDMVDLLDFIEKNEWIYSDLIEYAKAAIRNAVVYQVAGPYRADSNGLSFYYPYTQDEEIYESMSEFAATDGLMYMYDILFQGAVSMEAYEYFTEWMNDFGDAPEIDAWEAYEEWAEMQDEPVQSWEEYEEWDFSLYDAAEFDLEDWPIDIYEDDEGIEYACLDIGAEAASMLQSVTFMLMLYDDDGNAFLLGEEFDIVCDWEEGFFEDNFRGVWGAIDDHFVYMEVSSITDDYILYEVPLYINDRLCNLSVAYVWGDEEYRMLTATPDNGDGPPLKEQILLKSGDIITPLMAFIDEDIELIEMESFEYTRGSEFHEKELPDGLYSFMYLMTDYQNNYFYSDTVEIGIEDGYIELLWDY